MSNFNLPEEMRCFLHHDLESRMWVSRCLNFDLVTSGETEEAAWGNLKAVVKLHIEHCYTHNHDALATHRAPDEDFLIFDQLAAGGNVWSDKIKLNLVVKKKPETPDDISFWIKGVDSGFKQASNLVSAVH